MSADRSDDSARTGAGADAHSGEEPWRSGAEHLQAAAREMIAATRALLDAAEAVVEDPRAAASTVDLLSSMVSMARPRSGANRSDAVENDDPDDGEPPVQRIPVT